MKAEKQIVVNHPSGNHGSRVHFIITPVGDKIKLEAVYIARRDRKTRTYFGLSIRNVRGEEKEPKRGLSGTEKIYWTDKVLYDAAGKEVYRIKKILEVYRVGEVYR